MNTVSNFSTLNPTNFRFQIVDAPYLSFFAQDVDLPSITLGDITLGTPFTGLSVPGDQLDFGPLNVTYLVDEDLNGYREINSWMRGLGFPTSFEEYESWVSKNGPTTTWNGTTSDIQVTTMTGSRNLNFTYRFVDAYPIILTAPKLSTTQEGTPIVTCQATFRYTYFNIGSAKTI